MAKNKLTQKQEVIYDFIKSEIKRKGYPPSVREICDAVNLSSTSTVHAHLESLQKKGFISRAPSKNRSIEILEKNFYSLGEQQVFAAPSENNYVDVPIVGVVTAGLPILATENIEETFPIPTSYVRDDVVFMLRIRGDSMIDAGIFNKDLVLVRQQSTASNGDIVVALLDDSATVKRYFRENSHIRLQPENPAYEPIISEDVVILGKVIGLFRSIR